LSEGAKVVVELSGLGKLSPNMVLIGFRDNWMQNLGETEEYFKTLQAAFEMRLSVGVLRINGGLDVSKMCESETGSETGNAVITGLNFDDRCESKTSVDSGLVDDQASRDATSTPDLGTSPTVDANGNDVNAGSNVWNRIIMRRSKTDGNQLVGVDGTPLDCTETVVKRMTQFRNSKDRKEGTIDVYWLYDDGGLTLLLPHILSTRAKFDKCKLRVFVLSAGKKAEDLDKEARNMATLLAKFRIEFQDVVLLNDATKRPSKQTKEDFKQMIRVQQQHKLSTSSRESAASSEPSATVVSEEVLGAHAERTNFHLRMAEIVRQNSSDAQLVVMTLPLPKKTDSHALYMAWLDYTTRQMPPFLLVRGNQESVLTFYS